MTRQTDRTRGEPISAHDAIALIEVEAKWHQEQSKRPEYDSPVSDDYMRGYIAGLNSAARLIAEGFLMTSCDVLADKIKHLDVEKQREELREADRRLVRTSDIAAQYGRKPR